MGNQATYQKSTGLSLDDLQEMKRLINSAAEILENSESKTPTMPTESIERLMSTMRLKPTRHCSKS
ncbi:hypothetical protein DSCW_35690 [Desulfosarcina widdelii]|uniref:Uncharacterized protein n=1 Tax=Desulfosarcina widdelii TaxID=947919 RepID=A0A5K7Z2B6_9BACT|nr:hypothetical protein [Desulfosarcina widdelii]BBO76152.1 hypothetical protein DSCW_35690 [Desulfosarcina widdelii]